MSSADQSPFDLIILGASARAAAQSAVRAGYRPWCADLFADRDLAALAPVRRCPLASYPLGLLDLVQQHAPQAPILLTGAMENAPQLLASLEEHRPLLHARSADIAAIRRWNPTTDPLPAIASVQWCETHDLTEMDAAAAFVEMALPADDGPPDRPWIIKPDQSASGVDVERVQSIESIHWPSRVQQFIPGISLGVVWRSHDGVCELLGVTRQVLGDEAFGVTGFRYAGSIGPWPVSPGQNLTLIQLGQHLTQKFSLRGIWGSDVIVDDAGDLWPVEFNPRYTASVEVLEKACDFAALNPQSQPAAAKTIQGKAYVFARRASQAPDFYEDFSPDQIADVPAAGSDLRPHQPICTVFAQGQSHDQCLSRLQALARQVYTRLT